MKSVLDNSVRNKRIVKKLCMEIKRFKKMSDEYSEKGDHQSANEVHLIWYYLFGCLGKDSDKMRELL